MRAGVGGRPAATDTVHSGKHLTRRLRWPAAMVAGTVGVFGCALIQARQVGTHADGGSMVLESWAMWHGNPLLHGWYLADVTWYTTELPEYMLVEAFRGIQPDVVRISAALTYTLVVIFAVALAYETARRAGKRAGLAGAVITLAVLLGPLPIATDVLLNDPDHVGTAVPVLLAFLLAGRFLDGRPRSGVRRWALPAAIAAVLAWTMVGDRLMLLVGVAPLVLVCGGRAAWQVLVRRQPLARVEPEAALGMAGLAGGIVGGGLNALIPAIGGYHLGPLGANQLVPPGTLPRNVGGVGEDFLVLFSVYFKGARLDGWLAVTAVHLAFACLVAGAIVLVLSRFFRGEDLINRLLATAIVVNMAGYALLYPVTVGTARELGPVFGLGGALAGRVLGELLVRRGREWLVAVAAVAALAIVPPPLLTVVARPSAAETVADFLASHHLRSGLGGFWQANNITVETRGRVTMVPLHEQPGIGLAPYRWQLNTGLLTVPGHQANFVVATKPGAVDGVTMQDAISLFGQPAHVYPVSPAYFVMVWNKNLLPELPRVTAGG